MKKQFFLKVSLLATVILTAQQYAHWAYQNRIRAEWIVSGEEIRPYVYRAFVPFLARVLVFLGMGPEQALTVVVVASAIALVYGIQYLLRSLHP